MKKYLMGVAALALGFTLNSFTTDTARVEQTWFYISDSSDPSALDNPANYQTTPPQGANCGDGEVLCNITDEASSSNPNQPALSHGDVSENMAAYSPNFRNPLSQ